VPLRRRGRLTGSINLRSDHRSRLVSDKGTDFI
jgi:hypothetical protein